MDIQFIDPVLAVIEEVERISGKGIEFIQKDDIPGYVVLQMARNHMPSHLIYHKKEHDEIINHLVVHECVIFYGLSNARRIKGAYLTAMRK